MFITIGTTVEQVARALLNHNHLRIITNSLRVAHILYNNPRFEVMVPGERYVRITVASLALLPRHLSLIFGPTTWLPALARLKVMARYWSLMSMKPA